MTFQQLTYVVEVAHCASINKAAEHLYTHQSNVSNVIRQLEEELNVQLFFRTQKGVQLTSAGREFLVYAQDLVDKKKLLEQMYTLRNTHQPSRFCVSSMRSFFAYAPLIAMDQKHGILSQPWNIRIQKRPLTGVLEDVSCGEADLGLLFTMKSKRCRLPQLAKMKQVICTPLGESRLHIIVREGHPILSSGSIESIAQYPYIIIENQENGERLYDEGTDSLCSQFAQIPQTILSTSDSMTCQNLVASTDAFFISTTPWRHNRHYPFVSIPLNGDDCELTFYAVTRAHTQPSPMTEFYLSFLRDFLRSDDSSSEKDRY